MVRRSVVRIITFAIIGIIATLTDAVFFNAISNQLDNLLLAKIVAFSFGIILNLTLNRMFTFVDRKIAYELYFLGYFLGFIINLLTFSISNIVLDTTSFTNVKWLSWCFANLTSAIFNYFFMNSYTFRKNRY